MPLEFGPQGSLSSSTIKINHGSNGSDGSRVVYDTVSYSRVRNTGRLRPRYFLVTSASSLARRQAGEGQRYSLKHRSNPDTSNPAAVGFQECTAA